MIIIVKLKQEQWKKINELKMISSYGIDFEFFNSFEDTFSDKVVTLNARPMWKKESAKNPPEKRIELYHIIFELPNSKFTVSSKTFNKRINIWTNKELNIDRDQIKYYDLQTHQIYENRTLNYPIPETMRGVLWNNRFNMGL